MGGGKAGGQIEEIEIEGEMVAKLARIPSHVQFPRITRDFIRVTECMTRCPFKDSFN